MTPFMTQTELVAWEHLSEFLSLPSNYQIRVYQDEID